MNRKQFMEELSQLLIGISEEERVEALPYITVAPSSTHSFFVML